MNFLNGAIFAFLVHILLNRVPMDHYFGSKTPKPRHSLTQRDYPKGEGVKVRMIHRPIRVMLRGYRYEKRLEEEFSNLYDAQGTIELIHKNNPDLIVEPYVRLSEGYEIEISGIETDEL